MTEELEHMPLIGHIREFKKRVVRSFFAIGAAFIFTYAWADKLYDIIALPLFKILPSGDRFFIFTDISEPFTTYLKIAFIGAVIAASPYVFFQLWAFIAPALYHNERRIFAFLVFLSLMLFAGGVLFAYFFVLPVAFKYLLSFSSNAIKPYISMGQYLSSAFKFLAAFGAAFQLPLILLVLSRMGMINAKMLIGWWRYAVVASFIIGAIFTPPDVVSQLLLSIPLVALYGVGAALSAIFGRKK